MSNHENYKNESAHKQKFNKLEAVRITATGVCVGGLAPGGSRMGRKEGDHQIARRQFPTRSTTVDMLTNRGGHGRGMAGAERNTATDVCV